MANNPLCKKSEEEEKKKKWNVAAGLSADDLGPNFHLLMSLDHYDDFKVLNFHGRRQIVNLMDEKSILRLFAFAMYWKHSQLYHFSYQIQACLQLWLH